MRIRQVVVGAGASDIVADAATCIRSLVPTVDSDPTDVLVMHVGPHFDPDGDPDVITSEGRLVLVVHEGASVPGELTERAAVVVDGRAVDRPRVAPSDDMLARIDAMGATSLVLCTDRIDRGYPLDALLGAQHLLVTRRDPLIRLVVTGGEQAFVRSQIDRFVAATHLDTVWRLDDLAVAEIEALIARASIVVCLGDTGAGFLAVRRALSIGTPVIGQGRLLRAVAGDAALVLPADCGSALLAEGVIRIIDDQSLREALAVRGVRRAQRAGALDIVEPVLLALREVVLQVAR